MKSKKPLNVNLFKVKTEDGSERLDERLKKIETTPLAQRVRHIGYKIRLEEAKAPSTDCPYWLLDFAKLRFDGGPGRASEENPTSSFDLVEGEGFSEETAMLYDPKSNFALLQYNHHGPRMQAIADYLSIFDPEQSSTYDLRIQLRADAQTRLEKKKIFTRLEIKVAPALLSDEYKKKNVSLTSMLKQQTDEFGGDTVAVTIGLERFSSASLKLKQFINTFKVMANEERDAVTHLTIVGRDEADAPVDAVDLIAEKEQLEYKNVEMDTGLRYLRGERWRCLQAAYGTWKSRKVIQ